MKLRSISLLTSAAGLLACVASPLAHAFTLTPMSLSLSPAGPEATQNFLVENNTQETVLLDVSITSREMDETGKESNRITPEIESNFLLYPPQMTLKPKEKRSIRVTWMGPLPPHEKAFRLVAEQLPLGTQKKNSLKRGVHINILMRYQAALYVTPDNAAPLVVLKSSSRTSGENPKLQLVLENSGSAHLLLKKLRVEVERDQVPPVKLEGKELDGILGQNILAQSTRKFEITWPKKLKPGSVKVKLEATE